MVSECWNLSGLCPSLFQSDCFSGWMTQLLDSYDSEYMAKVVSVVWGIWKQRNNWLWNRVFISAANIVHHILHFLHSWQQAQEKDSVLGT